MTTKDPDPCPEQVPDSVVAGAKAAFGRKAQGSLAILVHDSLIDQDDAAADHRLLFEHPQMFIELQVSVMGPASRVTGRVTPPGPARAQLEGDRTESASSISIDDGVFIFQEIPHGTVRIVLAATGDDPPVHTDWFRI